MICAITSFLASARREGRRQAAGDDAGQAALHQRAAADDRQVAAADFHDRLMAPSQAISL